MERREIWFLVLLILVVVVMRSLTGFIPIFRGADAFYHYTVVEKGLENKVLTNANPMDRCYSGANWGHPVGFYAIPYYLSFVFGLDWAFLMTPVLMAVLTIVFSYFLFSILFNKRIALYTCFLVAVAAAHMQRSSAFTYRGDNLLYPFIIISLFFLIKMFLSSDLRKKLLFGILAGFVSGLSAIMWNGYMVCLIIFAFTLCLYILYQYLIKKKIKLDVLFCFIALLFQYLIVFLISKKIEFWGRGLDFYQGYYLQYLIFPVIGFLLVLLISELLIVNYELKKPFYRILPLVLMIVVGAVFVYFNLDSVMVVAKGFGSFNRGIGITESAMPSFSDFVEVFWILLFTFFIGLVLFFRKIDSKKIFFLGMFLPLMYMALMTLRYLFIASVPFILFSGIFLEWLVTRKKIRKEYLFLPAVFIVIVALFSTHGVMAYVKPSVSDDMINALFYIRGHTPAKSCVIGQWDRGGQIQYFSKRYSYASLYPNPEIHQFFYSNRSPTFGVENAYVIVDESEISRLIGGIRAGFTELTMNNTHLIPLRTVKTHKAFDGAQIILMGVFGSEYLVDWKEDDIKAYRMPGKVAIKTVYLRNNDSGEVYVNPDYSDDGCVYFSKNRAGYFSRNICESNLFKMLAWQDINYTEPRLKKFYVFETGSVYKIID